MTVTIFAALGCAGLVVTGLWLAVRYELVLWYLLLFFPAAPWMAIGLLVVLALIAVKLARLALDELAGRERDDPVS